MDSRLFEAAQTGDTILLHQSLIENPLVFDINSLFSLQNALHISSISGHVDFTREILRLKPEFAGKLDANGFSPLHMAAARGNVEITKELMMFDPKLCRLQGRDKKTPLHCAAETGEVGVVNEMVSRCVECLEDATMQGESALHLAVKNYQFEAVKVVVKLIREKNRKDLLNLKDEKGNTALHLATWTKQRQVVELLLAKEATSSEHLEVNAINQSGLTPVDLLHIFPSVAGDNEIEEALRNSGAMRSGDVNMSSINSTPSSKSNTNHAGSGPREESLLEYIKFKRGRDSPDEARTALLVIATLVATTTFHAGFNPPGGLWQESNLDPSSPGEQKHKAGWSILGTSSAGWFAAFMFFNSVGFLTSLAMIGTLTSRFPLQLELQICRFAMFYSYSSGTHAVSPDHVRLFSILTTSILNALSLVVLLHSFREPI